MDTSAWKSNKSLILTDSGKVIKNSSELYPNLMFDGSGTLLISKLDISMKGSYTCTADNGIGKPLQKTIFISVQGRIYGCYEGLASVMFNIFKQMKLY